MFDALLLFQFFIIFVLIISVLLQQSAGDGLSGLGGGGNGLISGKSSATLITKMTFALAFIFMANSFCLAKLTIIDVQKSGKLLETIDGIAPEPEEPEISVPELK